MVFLRLKEIPLVKNVLVSALWGLSVFAVPRMQAEGPFLFASLEPVAFLVVALAISTLNSTVFNDVLDRTGDLLARNPTLPVLVGNAKTIALLLAVDGAWLVAVVVLAATGVIDAAHGAFLTLLALYPLTYLLAYRTKRMGRVGMTLLAEGDLSIFTGGLLLLARLG
jgi:4-hydroxy-3-methylbut-2-enyl diphosphate reductase